MPRTKLIPGLLAGAAILALIAAPAAAETLADAVALAYESNPNLQAQRAAVRATDENYDQAMAGYRPNANVQATVSTNTNNQKFGNIPTGDFQYSNAIMTVNQPVYTGGRVASQVTAAEASILAARAALRSTEQQVLLATVQAYTDVRRDQESVAISQEDVTLLKRQLDESRARFAVGEITRTDVAQTESRVAAAQAALSTAQAQLGNSRATYVAVVGQSPGQLAPEPTLAKLLPTNVDQALAAAEHNNPQIVQAGFTEQVSAAKVAQAKAQYRPTVALQGTAGYGGGALGLTSPFLNTGYSFTATATASVPLFTGGLTASQIRQAAENNNIDRIGIETTRRQVLLSVSQAWNGLLGSRATLLANQEAVRAANIAFEGTRQEAQVGLRTTLDVLISEQDLGNAQLALVNSRHDEYVAAAALLASMGQLFVDDLAQGVPLYDPVKNFEHIRRDWRWSPWDVGVAGLDHAGGPKPITRPPPPPEVPDPAAPVATAP